jgi:hypothetical protein
MSSKASKAAYRRCCETCPKVRTEIGRAIEFQLKDNSIELPSIVISRLIEAAFEVSLQHGTEPLRAALVDCEEELMETRSALDIAESDRTAYRLDAVHWENHAFDLQSQLDSVPST